MKKLRDILQFKTKKRKAEEKELESLERVSKGFRLNHAAIDKEIKRMEDVKAGKVPARSKKYDVEGIRRHVNRVVLAQEAKMPEVEARIKVLRKKLKKDK